MNAKTTITLFLFLALAFGLRGQSNLFIDTSYTAEEMVMDFFDNPMVTPSNVVFTGGSVAFGYFEGATTDLLELPAGIFLSTGQVTDAAQPAVEFASTAFQVPGDGSLDDLLDPGFITYDASVLEFDLTVNTSDTLHFTYVFGSEEYPEYVGSSFNDIFAFFVSGPGLPDTVNTAMIPDTTLPVAINNVNGQSYAQYYIANDTLNGQDIVYDGLTKPLEASFVPIAGETYHVKIALSDAGDYIFDSGVFISIGSLMGSDSLLPPAILEANVDGNTVYLTNDSRYATSWQWDFGDGTTSTERHPGSHTYQDDGYYEITLITQNYCCSDTLVTPVTIGTVSTDEIVQKPFELSPNPASDVLQVTLSDALAYDFQILDVSGRVLQIGQISGSRTFSLAGFEPGMYLLQLRGEKGAFTERFMVRR